MPLFLQTIFVSFGMFSIFPTPPIEWNEKNLRFAFLPLPLVGAVIGGLACFWCAVCNHFGIPSILRGAILCVLPVLLTGGFHMDGFADTSDALASHAAPDKKQQILKDSHIGAFALIRVCEYFILHFGLCCAIEFSSHQAIQWWVCFILSRSVAGYAICSLPLARGSGLAHTFQSAADKKLTRLVLAGCVGCCSALLVAISPLSGSLLICAALGCYLYFKHMANVQFGGVSGDLGGWLIQTMELFFLVVLTIHQYFLMPLFH